VLRQCRIQKRIFCNVLPFFRLIESTSQLYPGTRTVIVLKQPKTEGSIRTVYIPETVAKKLEKLREMQMKLKLELGDDGYMDYGLIICQANGRPIMTEHLNTPVVSHSASHISRRCRCGR